MAPLVSICIPAYEQPGLLVRALESVFAQDFSDFEVIVTDDSRDDQVEQAVSRWRADARFCYHRNSTRLDSPGNWNLAMSMARGRLVKFLHHDDWFARVDSLRHYVNALEAQPSVDFAFSASNACDSFGRTVYVNRAQLPQLKALERESGILQFANFFGAPSATIFRRQEGFMFDTNLRWVVDVEAYLRLIGKGVSYVDEPLVSVTADGAHQVTCEFAAHPEKRVAEHLYLYAKHPLAGVRTRVRTLRFFIQLLARFTVEDIAALKKLRWGNSTTMEEMLAITFSSVRAAARHRLRPFASRLRALLKFDSSQQASYSQSGEDVIVAFLFMRLGLCKVSYLDIGANHPTRFSNTYLFYRRGNKGVLVEPDADLCRGLRRARRHDRVLNVAVGPNGDSVIPMYIMTSRTLNTLDKAQAEALHADGRERIEQLRNVRLLGINELLVEQFGENKPNYVSLDIGGGDLEILQAWDFQRFRPEVFCVATLTCSQDNSEAKISEIIDLMRARDYTVHTDTCLNTVFVSCEAWRRRPVV